ncbi:MAG: flagellar filament capping protein FliD [Planctomycetaceae bacterium]
MLTIDGLISGIDTEAIVAGLLNIQQQQIDLLGGRKNEIAAKQGAFQAIQNQLLSLRSSGAVLARSQNSVFNARVVNVSDEQAVLATAAGNAATGVSQIRINSLARAHQVASQGFAEEDAAITQGTLTLQSGSASPVTLTIDSTNDTLEGLAAAINGSNAGVSASIIRDSSGSGTPSRLLLTGKNTGVSQQISITNNLAADGGGAIQPTFDLGNPVQQAADASITLGSGAGAITVQSATNTVNNLISGVSLTLRAADAGKEITVSVEADTEQAATAVGDFVETFNGLVDFINTLSKFDAASGQGGLLLGNRNASSILETVRSSLLNSIPGLGGGANRLTALGVSVDGTGKLQFNQSKLDDILKGRDPHVNPNDVKRVFALDGQSSHASVRFIIGSSRTQPSKTPYQIDITQAAARAGITAANPLAASTVIDGTNNSLRLTVDGVDSGSLTLTDGTYTQQQLADHVESVLNTSNALVGRSVSVSVKNDKLVVTSDSYGSTSQVTVGSGSANAALGFSGTENEVGKDVAGTFIVDGVTETATGRGQLLTGNSDNQHTADLQVRISLTPADVLPGIDAELAVTQGLAARLDQVLNQFLDPVTGRFKIIKDGFDSSIENLQRNLDRQTASFERQREKIVRDFTALESAISELNNTSSFLASQLAGISSSGGLGSLNR